MQSENSLVWRGANIHYRRSGRGPALLLLKSEDSLPADPDFLAALSQDFDVVVPDHPGFGRSASPEWLKGIGDAAYFYLDFLAQLNLKQVHVVGCSLGGWLAAEIAIRDCGRLASLNLIAPFGVRRKGVPFGDIFLWTPEENLRNRFFDQAHAERFLAAALAQTPEQATAHLKDRYTTARLGWNPRFHNPELERWLHRIDRPLHLIWGDSDQVVPAAVAETWRERLPQTRLTIVERCGHLPQIEQPKATADRIKAFIIEVAP
ncbi:MAG: alpha/beta fold hydrolase [Rhizobiales bacterium]|nr:alpha/beta fold hydrolase [Hyphomicrobiales bacterium]